MAETFFIDRALGRVDVPNALTAAGAKIVVHDREFAPNTPDVDWLPIVAARGWIVLTKDLGLRRKTNERQAIAACGARVFALTKGDLRGEQMATAFVAALPGIHRFVRVNDPPFIARVSRTGRVDPWLDARTLLRS